MSKASTGTVEKSGQDKSAQSEPQDVVFYEEIDIVPEIVDIVDVEDCGCDDE